VPVGLYGVRNKRLVLREHQEVLHHENARAVLRAEQERHLLRQYGMRSQDGLLQGCLLRSGTDLRQRSLLFIQRGGVAFTPAVL